MKNCANTLAKSTLTNIICFIFMMWFPSWGLTSELQDEVEDNSSHFSGLPQELQFKILHQALGVRHGRVGVLDQRSYAALRLTSKDCKNIVDHSRTWANQVRVRIKTLPLVIKRTLPLQSLRVQGSILTGNILEHLVKIKSLKSIELVFLFREHTVDMEAFKRLPQLEDLIFSSHLYPTRVGLSLTEDDMRKISKLPLKKACTTT